MIEVVVGILVLTAALIVFVASLGIVRFRNLYSRMHVVTKVSSFAILILLFAVNLLFFSLRVMLISLVVFHVIVFLSPVAAHVIAKVSSMLKEDAED